jgi:hypothetical protein
MRGIEAAQDKADAEQRQRSEIDDLKKEVDALKQRAECEARYRSMKADVYRELTLTEVCGAYP